MKKDIVEKISVESSYVVEVIRKPGPLYRVKIRLENKNLERDFKTGKRITITYDKNNIFIKSNKATKKEKRLIKTIKGHILNMLEGLKKQWVYKLEICYSHFPITVSVDNTKKKIIIKNFFGENVPRYAKLLDGVSVEVKGNIIEVKSIDKELAGRQASLIEQATRITNRDRRIFQDGIWIIEKAGKPV